MTKAEIIKIIENIADNEEIIFIEDARDPNEFFFDRANANVCRIAKAGVELRGNKEYGVYTKKVE